MSDPSGVRSSSSNGRNRLIAWGTLALAVLITLPPALFPAEQVIKKYRVLDTSWQLSMPMLFGEGKLSGRDFIYTYGPVYQFTQSLGLVIPPGDLASVSRFRSVPEHLIVLFTLWWALGLTGASVGYRSVVFLLWCVFLAAPGEYSALQIKPMAGVPAAALCGVLLGRRVVKSAAAGRITLWLVWGIGPPLLTLYSFDFGVIFTATLLGTAIVHAIDVRHLESTAARRSWVDALGGAVCSVLGMVLLLGGTQLLPGWSNYTPHMFELVTAYGNAMALGAKPGALVTLGLVFCLCGGFLLHALWRSPKPDAEGNAAFATRTAMLAVACFSLLMVRYGLTRTDWFHVYTAIVPAMFLFGCLLPARLYAKQEAVSEPTASKTVSESNEEATSKKEPAPLAPYALPVVVLIVPMLIGPLAPVFLPAWKLRLAAMSRFSPAAAEIKVTDETLAEATAASGSLPNQSLFVWPFGVELNLLSGKDNPSYTLQSAEGAIGGLEQETLTRLQETEDVAGLLYLDAGTDTKLSRTSEIVRYLLDGYELSHAPQPGFALLKPVSQEGTWRETEIELPVPKPAFVPGQGTAIQIPLEGVDCRVSDILVAEIQIAKTSTFPVGKPGICFAVLFLEDDTPLPVQLQVQPDGKSHTVLISGLDLTDPRCLTHFVPERTWRTTERVKMIQIGWQPHDVLSKAPAEIRLERLAVLEREGAETKDTPLTEEENPEVWEWCFGPLPAVPQ